MAEGASAESRALLSHSALVSCAACSTRAEVRVLCAQRSRGDTREAIVYYTWRPLLPSLSQLPQLSRLSPVAPVASPVFLSTVDWNTGDCRLCPHEFRRQTNGKSEGLDADSDADAPIDFIEAIGKRAIHESTP